MKHHLTWKMDPQVREKCIEVLKEYNEGACSLIRQLHVFAFAELTGNSVPRENIADMCPEYGGPVPAVKEIKRLVTNELPRVVYFDVTRKEARLSPYDIRVVECSWCRDDDFEESLLCPSCYGTRKSQETVVRTSIEAHDTLDVFVCAEVMELLNKELP